MNHRLLLFLGLFGCEEIVKSEGSQENFECDLYISGTDNLTGETVELFDSSYELLCSTESDKSSQMEENCDINESNYTSNYTDLVCDWSCESTSVCE